ncbi:mCG147659 [Mus musculus]|nr:mCG147659 [Mus musculus]
MSEEAPQTTEGTQAAGVNPIRLLLFKDIYSPEQHAHSQALWLCMLAPRSLGFVCF